MIDKYNLEKITAKAYSIWEWRMANNIPGSAEQDWEEAQSEIILDRRTTDGCPVCNFPLLARNNGEIFCLSTTCDWKIKHRRSIDKDIAEFSEIKKDWQ